MRIKLDEGAKMPTKAHETDAGFDLYSTESAMIPAHGNHVFDTGVHIELPENTAGLLVSKSGLNVKYDLTSTGLIDYGYTGSIKVKLYNNGSGDYLVESGDKITQLVIIPIFSDKLELTDELEHSDRGDNGFGSSGR